MGLSNCCFCVPLRTGALVIGIVLLVSNALLLISSAFLLTTTNNLPRRAHTDDENLNMLYADSVSLVTITNIATLVLSIFHIIFNTLLVYGVGSSSRCAVLSWLIWYSIFNVLGTLCWFGFNILLITRIATLQPEHRGVFGTSLAISLPAGGAGLALIWYFYVCVLSFYRTEKRGEAYCVSPEAVLGAGAGQKPQLGFS